MNKKDCYYLGKVTKTHGYKGGVTLFLDTDQPESYYQLENVFLDINNSEDLIPFFIKDLSLGNNNRINVRFEGYNQIEDAKKITNKSVYLPLTFLKKKKDREFYFYEIIGYEVEDANKGKIGVVKEIMETNGQSILQIEFNGKEVLIPAADEFLIKIDKKSKTLLVKTPEGLLDLYL